ncbi:DUF551 domain-containing protein [Pedobacter sp.]|uniref:DUF551 domain-containing protein n=1 Tax=Pedobacter sp. TaxID=1411316 RepID=UPI003D7FEED6
MTSALLVPITATTVKHNMNATNAALSGTNKGKIMKIQTFINEFKLTFVYALLRQTLTDDQLFEHSVENGQVIWFKEQMRQMWLMWEKAQAVPEWISVNDQLPPSDEMVLICWSDSPDIEPEKDFMDICVDTGCPFWANSLNDEPSHWMPLPKAQEPTND